MKDLAPHEILTEGFLEHPAVRAWNEVQLDSREPTQIQVLKRKNKSVVYRLQGAGPKGENVIAKRCLAPTALLEQVVYKQILPGLPVSALQYYGSLPDADSQFHWLFLEDAGTQPYLPESQQHRAMLSEWLAMLHTSSQRHVAAGLLPARGAAHFLEHLRLARLRIQGATDNPALTQQDRALLAGIVSLFDSLESKWRQVEDLCEGMPRAFVHGDLKEKNLRVRKTAQGLAFVCFDWETAGWGLTGPDLAKWVDCSRYCLVAQQAGWHMLQAREFERLRKVGILFRTLAAMHWETSRLQFQWLERPRLTLRVGFERLTEMAHNFVN